MLHKRPNDASADGSLEGLGTGARKSLLRPEQPVLTWSSGLAFQTTPHPHSKCLYEWQGTPFDVGRQHGQALRSQIRTELVPYLNSAANKLRVHVSEAARYVVSRYEALFRERMPKVLEEIQGIAEGARLSYEQAFVLALHDMMPLGGCTAVACSGPTSLDGPLIAQTKDVSALNNRFKVMRIRYSSGRSMVLLNYPGWIANTGLTSDGVAFAGFSLNADEPQKPIAPGSLLKRLVLEKRSTAEVLDGITGLSFPNGGFLVGDRSGHMVCIEALGGRVAIRDVSGKAFGHCNGVLTSELKPLETESDQHLSSVMRQTRIDKIFAEQTGRISISSLREVFRDHLGFPLSICRHPGALDKLYTGAAFVANLTDLEIDIAIGHPCKAPFVRYRLDAAPELAKVASAAT